MKGIIVSAIITTHNRIDLLKKAIHSVEIQSFRDMELIIVDDNSSDETQDYLQLYQSTLKKYTYIRIGENETKGGNYARNKGIISASGEYIAFLDDDDEWMVDKIEKQISFLRHNSSFGMVYCGRRVERNFKETEDILQDSKFRGDLKEKCFIRIFCVTSMIMIKRDLALEVSMFDEEIKYWQKYDFCIRVSVAGEGVPTILIEALSYSLPMVVTDSKVGPREILGNDEYGLLCKVQDPADMAEKINKLISDKSLYRKYQEKSTERLQAFKPETIKSQLQEVLGCVTAKTDVGGVLSSIEFGRLMTAECYEVAA